MSSATGRTAGDLCAILATRNVEFYRNRVFDPHAVQAMRPSLQPMARPWLVVAERARQRGLRLMTADLILDADRTHDETDTDARGALVVAYDWTPDAARLLATGAHPGALVSFEPPVIAWELYSNLRQVSARFPDTFLFAGAGPRVHAGSRFHPLHFPQVCPPRLMPRDSWSRRRFLAMVSSNKALARPQDLGRWLDRPREVSLKRLLAGLRYRPILRERYAARLRAIQAFANLDDFDLYGEGWHQRHPAVSPAVHRAAKQVYRGSVPDKLLVLSRYRFALAIENTCFPGYISEKLFDCFFAGCVPVYSGAPDVDAYVPVEAFINARNFRSWYEVERFLRNMSERDHQRYVEAGEAFLASPAFAPFSVERFATQLIDALVPSSARAQVLIEN
jgi:hypothetical protein